MKTQTILGSGGAVGRELAPALLEYTDRIRLVSRSPRKVNPDDEILAADLLDPAAVMSAVEGSAVVYLTAGLPYKRKVWEAQWPVIMRNVIAACTTHRARLVFFDNIYMYSGDRLDPITEELPIDPPSRKGAVRAHVAQMLLDAHSAGEIEALIARSADFYGPRTGAVSVLNETVFKPLSTAGTANWLGGADFKHSFTYVPDAARATALLGNTPEAGGEVWHLPTADNPPTGREWVEAAADALGSEARMRSAGRGIVRFMGLFSPIMRELVEMMYQYEQDYVFSSAKFDERFGTMATPYIEGIEDVAREDFGR